jgi:hypothetical protein
MRNILRKIRLLSDLKAAIELAQLTEHSVFALTAKPSPDARLTTLFAGNDAKLVRNFNNPSKLRNAGFSLEHDGNSRIVMGELRRVLIPSWKILELWRDGLLSMRLTRWSSLSGVVRGRMATFE